MVHFLVRISKNVSSEKPKQNLKRERVGGGEGKFTIPTLCPSDQERETGDKGNRSKEERQVRNGLFVRLSQEATKGSERTIYKGDFFHFCIFSHQSYEREREGFDFCVKNKVAFFVSFFVEIEKERNREAI